ncbi:MAG TPA: hypothetical protein VMR31_03970 [Myxococcota bacterium]|nr:hypothetical protein [Myxococcota bacterium]
MALALLAGCASHSAVSDASRKCEEAPELSWPDVARAAAMDPDAEVQQAIARHDLRVLGVNGSSSLEVPGVADPGDSLCWLGSVGIRPIEGTTPSVSCQAQAALQSRAISAAAIYNRHLVDYLHSTGAAPACADTTPPQGIGR